MALDTAAKRASALGFQLPWRTAIIPDGTLDQGDRQTAANAYSGILAAVAVIVVDTRLATQGVFTHAVTEGIVKKAETQGKFTRPSTTEGFIKP